ncbi:MAG TPA: hypothetical protein PK133_10400 [Ferruginibacter sp.]|mgnify:CR=1 FL=1|nr:hypothetical protein [Ferruginibacter sp.]
MKKLTVKRTDVRPYQNLPMAGHLDKKQFDHSKAIMFTMANKLKMLVVPPVEFSQAGVMGDTWLLLRETDHNGYSAQEIMLLPEKNKLTYKMMVVRRSGRLFSKGTVRIVSRTEARLEAMFPLTKRGKVMQQLNGRVKKNKWAFDTKY